MFHHSVSFAKWNFGNFPLHCGIRFSWLGWSQNGSWFLKFFDCVTWKRYILNYLSPGKREIISYFITRLSQFRGPITKISQSELRCRSNILSIGPGTIPNDPARRFSRSFTSFFFLKYLLHIKCYFCFLPTLFFFFLKTSDVSKRSVCFK